MKRYIFVTGGVVSSLGKGIISASIGKLLQARGYTITIQKFDPYINIDPGTLNPYEHGECYVTVDGMETDLDLGHYERFTGIRTTRANSVTTGRIYKTVIDKERHGDYLGKTIQVVPHITDEIKRRMLRKDVKGEDLDFVITEVGGTIGDIESAPFMEAIRQLRWDLGRDAVCVHLTYVPYLKAAEELKTKPTQHSVKELQGMGIQPDILVLRTERHLDDALRMKVASFCNVDLECVVQSEDLPSIYEVPVNMQRQGLDAAILRKIGIPVGETPAMKSWHDFLDKQRSAKREVHVALVGKYDLQDAYKSIRESLNLAGIYDDVKVKIHFIASQGITRENVAELLSGMAGIVICPGFGQRGIPGKILAAEYARTHDVPCFGICLGMQMMVIEFARNVLGQQRDESRHAAQRHRHHGGAEEHHPDGRHDAPGRVSLRTPSRQPGPGCVRRRDFHPGASPPPLRVQQPLPGGVREGRHALRGRKPGRRPGRDRGDPATALVHRHTVPSRVRFDGAASASAVSGLHQGLYSVIVL